nr:hypothetical protein [Tanacetum cinerariifolium]
KSLNNYIYGNGKPITCNEREGMLRGGFCFPCNLKVENSFICDQNAYSFNDNSNYLPQPQYESYLCNLCWNNSHDGYDCQQQFPFVYEQEPSYNQNYNDNYYPHELPNFPCCDNCGESHETFQCQPINQNVDFSGSDQIQTPQYPDVHPPSQQKSEEVFQAKGDLMKSIQTFLEKFICIPFEELAEYDNSSRRDRSIFLNDDEDHFDQNKECLEKFSDEITASNPNQKPPQDSDIHQLIEECSVEVCEEQKQSMEDTMLELVKIYRQKELFCMHANVDDLIESALNTKLLSINSQRLKKEQQEVKNVVEQLAERGNHSIESLQNFRDEIIKSGVEELVPILSENEVTLEDKRECDLPVSENSPVCDDHSDIFSNSKNDDDISSNDDDFEDIEYVEASLPDPEIVSLVEENGVEEENVFHQKEENDVEEEEIDLEDISQIQDIDLCEKLLSITRLISNIESLNDNPIPDLVLNSFVSFPIFEESDNSLSDIFSPEFETFAIIRKRREVVTLLMLIT